MDKFCTKCGKKIEEGELTCRVCNPQITSESKNNNKVILSICGCFLLIFTFLIILGVMNTTKKDDSSNNTTTTTSNTNSRDYQKNEVDDGSSIPVVENYPFESKYYKHTSSYTRHIIKIDKEGTVMDFATSVYKDPSSRYYGELSFSGSIENPKYIKGYLLVTVKFYDKDFNEIIFGNDTAELLGKGYSSIPFGFTLAPSDFENDKSISDIKYYKVILSDLDLS